MEAAAVPVLAPGIWQEDGVDAGDKEKYCMSQANGVVDIQHLSLDFQALSLLLQAILLGVKDDVAITCRRREKA